MQRPKTVLLGITLYNLLSLFAMNYELWATIRATNSFLQQIIVASDLGQTAFLHDIAKEHLGAASKKIFAVKSFDSTANMAQMVGVEPTRQSPVLKHFECSLLRPLEYICIFNFVARNFPQSMISSQSRYDRFDTSAYLVLLWMTTGEIPLKRQYNHSTQYIIVYQTYPLLSIRTTSASASASGQRGNPRGGGG